MKQKSRESVSSREYPRDRFDELPKPERVGAHRISGKMRRAWRYVLAAAIACAVLISAGILAITLLYPSGNTGANPEPQTPVETTVEAELDPTATIVVLNGTATPNLAAGVDRAITANEWGQIAFSQDADARDVTISGVFYGDEADKAAAEGLAQQLGGVSTYQSENYVDLGVRLVVLLGSDYAGPGFAEAEEITAQLGGDGVAVTQ